MSVITAFFQAIFQAICTIFPISESMHSAMFHTFSNNYSSSSMLTGIVHIGIALGIFASMYKLFIRLFGEFICCIKDLKNKTLKENSNKPARSFLYMLLLSFLPLILWLIPCGKKGFLYNLLYSSQTNGVLLEDGILIAVLGVTILLAQKNISPEKNTKPISIVPALAVGVLGVFSIPVSGLSFVGLCFCILLLLGVSTKQAFNFTFVSLAPILFFSGIVQAFCNEIKVGAVSIVIGIVLSGVVSFFLVRLFRHFVKNQYLKYFGIYDISLGVIALVIGMFQLIFK